MAETLQGIYSVPPCIVHTFDRVLRNKFVFVATRLSISCFQRIELTWIAA